MTDDGLMPLIIAVYVSPIIHEFGHFAIAQFFHLPVIGVQCGRPFWYLSFARGGIRFQFGLNPFGGQVRFFMWNGGKPREPWKYIAVFFAGPLAEVAIFIILWPHTQLCIIFFASAIFNLVPDGKGNDGAEIKSLLTSGRMTMANTEKRIRPKS